MIQLQLVLKIAFMLGQMQTSPFEISNESTTNERTNKCRQSFGFTLAQLFEQIKG